MQSYDIKVSGSSGRNSNPRKSSGLGESGPAAQ